MVPLTKKKNSMNAFVSFNGPDCHVAHTLALQQSAKIEEIALDLYQGLQKRLN
jgi:hypothetical protein